MLDGMKQSNGTCLGVWLTLGLIGLALNAIASQDISARIKARPATVANYTDQSQISSPF